MNLEKLKHFNDEEVSFIETMQVKDGVTCDVYVFNNDVSKDLGVVTVSMGHKTPLQKVLLGDKTIEGFISGAGVLTINKENGNVESYKFPSDTQPKEIEVKVGEIMQWEADKDVDLVFYEICYPPYKDGRYENL
jgi:hypothetical protein